MPGSPSLDFPKTSEIALFEISIPVLKFPKRGIRLASMEDVAD